MKKLLTLILALCTFLCLCACGNDTNNNQNVDAKPQTNQTETSSKEETTPKFEVTVTDADGSVVEGVELQLCNNEICLPPMKTDENGIAIFNTEITDGYKLSVMSCPEGYEYTGEAEIYLDEGETSFTLEITKK